MGNPSPLVSICLFFSLQLVFYQYTSADIYLHNPRGSNNRLAGTGANRRNANRVFDSQNNAKGGYNVGEKEEEFSAKEDKWYNMQYYMSGPGDGKTILPIEWTNQHGCGHPDLNCNIVLQYKCQPTTVPEKHRVMRNGILTSTPKYRKKTYTTYSKKENQAKRDFNSKRALNEAWEWYDKCSKRQRNKGLFTADQDLKGDEAKYTRQNPNGNRHGYECPEERDYYPYWHPADWIDIAVLANNAEYCSYYKSESFNTKPKGECMEKYPKEERYKHTSKHNNPGDCEANDRTAWVNFHNYLEIVPDKTEAQCTGEGEIWAIPYRSDEIDLVSGEPDTWKKCLVALPEPDCTVAPTSRTNHLGNGENVLPLTYDWVLPHFPSGQEQRCVLRIRYNISTNDYDPINTFASSNNNDDVISNDPDVEVGEDNNNKVRLQLAINTAQFGRTFQDRSHIFKIIPRKDTFKDCVIHNLNVKGKRGNIVETYPAVEYDFTPKHLEMKSSHCVHIQFTGSNRNPQDNDGEGRAKTDRNNLVGMESPDISYPLENTVNSMFAAATILGSPDDDFLATNTGADLAVSMATAGYFKTAAAVPAEFKVESCNKQETEQLDCFPPSFPGYLLKFPVGVYHYMCSRNNNFTNRNQKATITVTQG